MVLFVKAKPKIPTTTEHINGKKESERAQEIIDKYIREHRTPWEKIKHAYCELSDCVSRNYYV